MTPLRFRRARTPMPRELAAHRAIESIGDGMPVRQLRAICVTPLLLCCSILRLWLHRLVGRAVQHANHERHLVGPIGRRGFS